MTTSVTVFGACVHCDGPLGAVQAILPGYCCEECVHCCGSRCIHVRALIERMRENAAAERAAIVARLREVAKRNDVPIDSYCGHIHRVVFAVLTTEADRIEHGDHMRPEAKP